MRIVVAPDSFKGSLSALEAATAIAAGVRDALPDADIALVPLADGGEGTVDALVAAVPGSTTRKCVATGPLGEPITAAYGLLGTSRSTAVVEMAAASGLTLISPERRDPMHATTFGTGELIRAALSNPGIDRLIIGLGGSATNDGGAGALAALGVRFLVSGVRGQDDRLVAEPITPIKLAAIDRADASGALTTDAEIIIACDVTNPLAGPNGASAIFGHQKGANQDVINALDTRLRRFAPVLDRVAIQRGAAMANAPESLATRPGGGAAGGLAAGLMALFPQATMRPGIDLVLDTANFNHLIESADFVITGEGRLDQQTLSGKTICGVLGRTHPRGIRTIALVGSVDPVAAKELQARGLESAHGILDLATDVTDAMTHGPQLLRELARQVVAGAV